MTDSHFTGFPPDTLKFLRSLARNNTKRWFDAHRADYDAFYVEPAKAFVVAFVRELVRIDKDLRGEPKINGSIFRINCDIRFSKDKTPYKTQVMFRFWTGDAKNDGASSVYLAVDAKHIGIGVGVHMFDKDGLAAYRAAVDDDKSGAALAKAVAKLSKAGYGIGGEATKRVPRGFDPDHPRAELLKHKGVYAFIETPVPAQLHTTAFPKWAAAHVAAMAPVHRWLRESL